MALPPPSPLLVCGTMMPPPPPPPPHAPLCYDTTNMLLTRLVLMLHTTAHKYVNSFLSTCQVSSHTLVYDLHHFISQISLGWKEGGGMGRGECECNVTLSLWSVRNRMADSLPFRNYSFLYWHSLILPPIPPPIPSHPLPSYQST